jgi:hypothetical protein
MTDRWFRIKEGDVQADATWPSYIATGPTDDNTPKYDVDRWSANTIGGSPIYIVRVYADDSTLDSLAQEPQVTELTDTGAVDALNNANVDHLPSENRTASEWKQSFKMGGN